MNVQNLALKKGKDAVSHRTRKCLQKAAQAGGVRCLSTGQELSNASKAQRAREHVKDLSNKHKAAQQVKALEKDFFLSVLHSSTTKREAKSYIQAFDPSNNSFKTTNNASTPDTANLGSANGVNLGGFYGPAAVRTSPKFVQQPHKSGEAKRSSQIHVAVVKVREPQSLDDEVVDGIGKTLSQLERLGLISVVVVDCGKGRDADQVDVPLRKLEQQQSVRIIAAIERGGVSRARLIDNVVGVNDVETEYETAQRLDTYITYPPLLLTPLQKGIIPVIPSLGYTSNQSLVRVPASKIVRAITRELAGHTTIANPDEDPFKLQQHLARLHDEIALDKLIILDPLGGIPASKQENGYHVFLNMEQEFEGASKDFKDVTTEADIASDFEMKAFGKARSAESAAAESGTTSIKSREQQKWHHTSVREDAQYHLENLNLARSFLARLPPSASVLITSPGEAANLETEVPFQAGVVGTRRQRNPLIHNLLTDRPAFSSSLPAGRVGGQSTATITPTTIAKHGMSITILPDLRKGPWQRPIHGQCQLSLTDPQVDLPRLVHLIEDSFGRKLDVTEYLKRVNDRIAGIIIAGEYEGGAILTWEMPPDVIDDGSPESRARMVPYLDKFAVLKKKQGSATADLVFKAMVRDCFPNGVCWRSRKDNVVNKWYFERSRGTWKLPDTGWTMFWTTPDLSMNKQTFLDYQSVCRSIQPSWADGKAILD